MTKEVAIWFVWDSPGFHCIVIHSTLLLFKRIPIWVINNWAPYSDPPPLPAPCVYLLWRPYFRYHSLDSCLFVFTILLPSRSYFWPLQKIVAFSLCLFIILFVLHLSKPPVSGHTNSMEGTLLEGFQTWFWKISFFCPNFSFFLYHWLSTSDNLVSQAFHQLHCPSLYHLGPMDPLNC